MPNTIAPPPTRLISWLQLCLEADPDFERKRLKPWVYEMSNGRLFYLQNPVYSFEGE